MLEAIIGTQDQRMVNVGMNDESQNDVPIFVDQKTSDSEFLSYFGFVALFCIIIYFGKLLPEQNTSTTYEHKIKNFETDRYWLDRYNVFYELEGLSPNEFYMMYDNDMMFRKMGHKRDHFPYDMHDHQDFANRMDSLNMVESFSQAENGIKPFYKTFEIDFVLSEISPNQTFWLNLTSHIKLKTMQGAKRFIKVEFRKKIEIPAILPNNATTTNVSVLVMKDSCINYSYVNAHFEFPLRMKAKTVNVKIIHGNPAYNSLIVWLNINLPVILAVLILVRMCKQSPIAKEQMYCTILSIATFFYDKPLNILALFQPDEGMLSWNEFLASIYPGFLFFFIVHMFAACFNYKVKWFVEIIVIAFFSIVVFNALVDLKISFPLLTPDQNGSIFNYIPYNTKALYIAGLAFLFIYVIALKATGVDEHEARFNVYITITFVFGGLYFAFVVLVTNENFRIAPYAELIPFALANTFAFLMEYLHSDYSPSIDQIYQAPGANEADNQLDVVDTDNNGAVQGASITEDV